MDDDFLPPLPSTRAGRGFLDFSAITQSVPARKAPEPAPEPEANDDADDLFDNLPPIGSLLPRESEPVEQPPPRESEPEVSAPLFEEEPAPQRQRVPSRRLFGGSGGLSQLVAQQDDIVFPPMHSDSNDATEPPAPAPRSDFAMSAPRSDFGMSAPRSDLGMSATTPRSGVASQRQNVTLPLGGDNNLSMSVMPEQAVSMVVTKKDPTDYFEQAINNAMDRSFGNFKRMVSRDITNAFRPNAGGFDTSMFDGFVTDLVTEIGQMFEAPQSTESADEATLTRRLNTAFDDNAKPIRRMFQDAEVKAAQHRERRLDDLKQLANSVNELRTAVKSITDATLQELEKERFDAATRRDEEQSKSRALERKARSLKLKHADLESRLSHQKIEKESVERLMKQMDDARREWEESQADSTNSTSHKLQKEIELLRSELNNEANESFEKLMDECAALMTSVRDGLSDEICEMEFAERWAVSRMRSPIRRAPVSRFEQAGAPMGILQVAQQKIQANRKQRELNMREVSDHLRIIGDGQAQ